MGWRRLWDQVTLANQLTFLRLVAVPFFILALVSGRFALAFAIFAAAAATDLLDGLTARVFRQHTPLGTYLDPAADKLLMVSAFVLLTDYPTMFKDLALVARLPVPLTVLAISRDVLIVLVAALLYLAHGTTRFVPSLWGKLTTFAEMVTIGWTLWCNTSGRNHAALRLAIWGTLALILVSGLDYLRRTVRGLLLAGEREEGRSG